MPEKSIEQAMQEAWGDFPFEGYIIMDSGAYQSLAITVSNCLKPGSTILDFGAGACDKTALLSALGFQCAALEPVTHLRPLVPNRNGGNTVPHPKGGNSIACCTDRSINGNPSRRLLQPCSSNTVCIHVTRYLQSSERRGSTARRAFCRDLTLLQTAPLKPLPPSVFS